MLERRRQNKNRETGDQVVKRMDDEVTLGFKPWFSFLLSENPWACF